jgi:hypothetical protein
MTGPLLELDRVTKRFGRVVIAEDLSPGRSVKITSVSSRMARLGVPSEVGQAPQARRCDLSQLQRPQHRKSSVENRSRRRDSPA